MSDNVYTQISITESTEKKTLALLFTSRCQVMPQEEIEICQLF